MPNTNTGEKERWWKEPFRALLIENDDCNTHMNNIHEPIKGDIYFDGIEVEAFIEMVESHTIDRLRAVVEDDDDAIDTLDEIINEAFSNENRKSAT
jgi:hypothetical protein